MDSPLRVRKLVKSYRKLMTTTLAVLRDTTTMVRRLDQRMAEQRRGTHSTDSIYDAEVSVLRAEGGDGVNSNSGDRRYSAGFPLHRRWGHRRSLHECAEVPPFQRAPA